MHAAARQEGRERDSHLPHPPLPCRARITNAGTSARNEPAKSATTTGAPSHAPEEAGELDIAHPEPGRVDERRDEVEASGRERGDDPLDRGVAGGLDDERDHERRDDDPVRDDPTLEVGDRHGDEDERTRGVDERLDREAEVGEARDASAASDESEDARVLVGSSSGH